MKIEPTTIEEIDSPESKDKSENLTKLAYYRFVKNKMAALSAVFIIVLIIVAIFAPYIAPKHYADDDFLSGYLAPGVEEEFILGTDFLGRDYLSRIIYGARVSIAVAIIGAFTSFLIGVVYGLISGYLGGRVDEWMMRVVDILYAVPTLLFIILIMVYFRSGKPEDFTGVKAFFYTIDDSMGGMLFIFIGIGLTSWLRMARIVRAETLSMKQREFIEASVSQGFTKTRIVFRRILPNIIGPCIIAESMEIPAYILYEAFLSFIGLGVNPPMPSWGGMISEGIQGMRSYPYLILLPSIAMTITVLAFNFLGDGLRDAIDPKLKD